MPTLDEFFEGREDARRIFDALADLVHEAAPAEMRITKSQIAFRRHTAFAWAWTPNRYLRGQTAPLVLSVALRRCDDSPRWKQIVEPYPGRFMHHLELYAASDLDEQARLWLVEAWESAA